MDRLTIIFDLLSHGDFHDAELRLLHRQLRRPAYPTEPDLGLTDIHSPGIQPSNPEVINLVKHEAMLRRQVDMECG